MMLKVCENLSVKQPGSRCDAELFGVPSGSKLFTYGTIVVICGLIINRGRVSTAKMASVWFEIRHSVTFYDVASIDFKVYTV